MAAGEASPAQPCRLALRRRNDAAVDAGMAGMAGLSSAGRHHRRRCRRPRSACPHLCGRRFWRRRRRHFCITRLISWHRLPCPRRHKAQRGRRQWRGSCAALRAPWLRRRAAADKADDGAASAAALYTLACAAGIDAAPSNQPPSPERQDDASSPSQSRLSPDLRAARRYQPSGLA